MKIPSLKIRKGLAMVCIWIIMAGGVSPTWGADPAEVDEISIVGSANIFKEDVATARNQAIASGLTTAVDIMVMKLLSKETVVKEFKSINEILSDSTNAFIQNYKVLGESVAGKRYRVIVQVTVLTEKLKSRLTKSGIVTKEAALPAILFLLAEQKIEDAFPKYWWGEDPMFASSVIETTLSSVFKARHFTTIEHGIILSMEEQAASERGVDLTDQQVVDIGNHLKAEVVIAGKAWVEQISNTMGGAVNSYKGFVQIRAVRTDTGEVIGETSHPFVTSGSDEAAGGREAIEGAASLAGPELADKIMGSWKKAVQPVEGLVLLIEGTKNLGNFVTFRRAVKDIKGVKGLQLAEIQENAAVIQVDFEGSGKMLAEAMMLKSFENFGIHISEVNETRIRVKLVSK